MVAKFAAISDRLDEDSARMKKGSEALGIAQAGALEAIKARNGIQLSGPMNQPPTKPAGPTPGTQPTPEQETAMGQYNAQMNTYLANEQAAEDKARAALEHLDAEYARAADVMREVHGEPDPEDTPTTPVSGGGGGGGGLPPTGPVSPPGTPSTPESRDPRDPRGPRDSAIVEVRDPHLDDTTTPPPPPRRRRPCRPATPRTSRPTSRRTSPAPTWVAARTGASAGRPPPPPAAAPARAGPPPQGAAP